MMRSNRLAVALVAGATSLALAACGGGDATDSTDAGASETTPEGTGATNELVVTGTSGLKFSPEALQADAGEVTFTLTAEGVVHNIVVEGVNGDEPVLEVQAGATDSASVTLDAGEYTFYCSVAGHREAGMEGTLTVA